MIICPVPKEVGSSVGAASCTRDETKGTSTGYEKNRLFVNLVEAGRKNFFLNVLLRYGESLMKAWAK